jgi:hypothetical protein
LSIQTVVWGDEMARGFFGIGVLKATLWVLHPYHAREESCVAADRGSFEQQAADPGTHQDRPYAYVLFALNLDTSRPKQSL